MHHGMRRRCGASLMHPTRPELGDRAGQNCRTTFARPKQSQRISAKVWGIEPSRIYGAPCRGIILPMTRARNHANGVRSPSLPQLWLTAMLRAFVELVHLVASTIRMRLRRPAVNATRQMPQPLPGSKIRHPTSGNPNRRRKQHGPRVRSPYSLSSRKRKALSGTHCESTTHHQWFPALATLGRDDNR
jgi:hypothetical protein